MAVEVTSTNPVVAAIVKGTAPRPAQVAASRGILPLAQADLLELLVTLYNGDDAELKSNAGDTLDSQSATELEQTLRSPDIAPSVLSYFALRTELPPSIHESIITNIKTPPAAIAGFAAKTPKGELLELLSQNQQLLIQNPAILEAILNNSNRTAEAERRASEVKREFFEKERGAEQIANELRAQGNEAAAEFFEQSGLAESGLSAEDAILLAQHIEVPDRETDDSWLALEFIEEIYEETEEQRQATIGKILGELNAEGEEIGSERIAMINRIMKMGVKARVKMAMKGDREARNILIRDPNKLVSSAVVNNPRITEQEVEGISAMRSMSEEILRQLATNRQWSRSYTVMHNLIRNPRTPLANVMTMLTRLQLRDLAALTKNRNVSDAVRRQAIRLQNTRTGGKAIQ